MSRFKKCLSYKCGETWLTNVWGTVRKKKSHGVPLRDLIHVKKTYKWKCLSFFLSRESRGAQLRDFFRKTSISEPTPRLYFAGTLPPLRSKGRTLRFPQRSGAPCPVPRPGPAPRESPGMCSGWPPLTLLPTGESSTFPRIVRPRFGPRLPQEPKDP